MFRRPVLALCLLLVPLACSEAETPNASFDAGPRTEPEFDAGPGIGARDEPCASGGRCETNDLLCVKEDAQDAVGVCRSECDRDATDDPCGPGATCGRLDTDEGACLPAGGKDAVCGLCDEGFACTRVDTDAGQVSVCKQRCALPGDGGVTDPDLSPCLAVERCRPLSGSDNGVCIED